MCGVVLAEEGEKDALPGRLELLVGKLLSPLEVWEFEEAVVGAAIAQTGGIQLVGQPLAAIEGDVDAQRQPGLQPQMHEAELRMLEIEVVVQAFLGSPAEFQATTRGVPANLVGEAGLDGAEHADQALLDPVLASDAPGKLLLGGFGTVQIEQGPAPRLGHLFAGCTHRFRNVLGVGYEVLQQHADVIEIGEQALGLGQEADRPAETHAIETTERAADLIGMLLYKALHGVAPGGKVVVVNTSTVPPGATPLLFGVPAEGRALTIEPVFHHGRPRRGRAAALSVRAERSSRSVEAQHVPHRR